MRRLFATATVGGSLLRDNHKFMEEAHEIHSFSSDLLTAVHRVMGDGRMEYGAPDVRDPFAGKNVFRRKDCSR